MSATQGMIKVTIKCWADFKLMTLLADWLPTEANIKLLVKVKFIFCYVVGFEFL